MFYTPCATSHGSLEDIGNYNIMSWPPDMVTPPSQRQIRQNMYYLPDSENGRSVETLFFLQRIFKTALPCRDPVEYLSRCVVLYFPSKASLPPLPHFP